MRADTDLTVGRVGRHIARLTPGKCALDDGRRQVSYAELDMQADKLAGAILDLGVAKGDVVCAYLPNCIDYVLIVLAVARAGAIFSPINPRFKAYEVAGLIEQARPKLLFATADRASIVREAAARRGEARIRMVVVDEPAPSDSKLEPLARLLDRPVRDLSEASESDFFSLMFTSGTTGEPRGALATHRARMLWVLNAAIEYGLNEQDRYLGTMPQVHSAGLTFTLMHLYVGATVRILEHFEPASFLEIVDGERITSALTVPTMLTMIVEAHDKAAGRYSLKSLRRVITCGSPLPLNTKRRVIETISEELYDYYGSTESNSMSVLKPRDQLARPGSVGQPFTNVELMIAGADGTAVPPGHVGEVWCSNPSVMSEYRDRPRDTAAAFTGRWYHTGDLGYLDQDGYLYLIGRSKEVIVSGGVNIYPAEIEQVIMLHPDVLDCAIVGIPDEKWGETAKAFVVLREGTRLDLEQLQRHCSSYLADYKKPRALEGVPAIPKNAGGKTVTAALLEREKLQRESHPV